MRGSNARKGAGKVGEGENFSLLQCSEGRCVALNGHGVRHAEEVMESPLTCTTAQRIALRGVVPLNVQTRPEEWLSQNGRKRGSAPAAIGKRSRGTPVKR